MMFRWPVAPLIGVDDSGSAGAGDQRLDDAISRVAVPQLRRAPHVRDAVGQNLAGRADDARRVASHQTIGALLYGDRTFGVLAQRQAWDAERRRLLLQAAGIGEHQPRVAPQPQEIQVAERGDYADAG